MRHPRGETVSIKPFVAGALDSHNNSVEAWGEPVAYPGCAVAPTSMTEDNINRRGTTATLTVYAPPDITVGSRDHAIYRDIEYEVVGDPQMWHNPFTGAEPGCTFEMRRVSG